MKKSVRKIVDFAYNGPREFNTKLAGARAIEAKTPLLCYNGPREFRLKRAWAIVNDPGGGGLRHSYARKKRAKTILVKIDHARTHERRFPVDP